MREHGANSKQACLTTPVSVGSRGARRWLAGRLAVLFLGVLLAACQMRLSNVAEPSTPPSEALDRQSARRNVARRNADPDHPDHPGRHRGRRNDSAGGGTQRVGDFR